ncbi:MAG: hypothetical protein Q9199_002278 [Rusavskia elegans]
MSSTQFTPNMSSTQTTPEIGPDSPKGPREMHPVPGTSPKILKRKGKSGDLNFEQAWGDLLDEKVRQEMDKLVVDVRKEYTEGEQLPSEDAIAYTHYAKSWSELKKALRAKEKTKIKRDLAFRENHERQMESMELGFIEEGRKLRSGRRIRGFGRI